MSAIPKPAEFAKDSTTVLIVSTHERSIDEQEVVNNYPHELKELLNSQLKVLTDEQALQSNLSNTDIIVIGTIEGNSFLRKYISLLPIKIFDDYVVTNKVVYGSNFQIVTSWISPFNNNKSMIIHTAQKAKDIRNYFWSPLKENFHYWIAEDLVTIEKGDFIRYSQVWLPER